MNASIHKEDWRKKYLDNLSTLESEQQQFRKMEAVLKRVAGRLCIASIGQSSQLDAEIKKLQAALRREPSSEELDKLAVALTDAINVLDQPAVASPSAQPQTASPPAAITDDARVESVLSALLAELRRDPELVAQVDALDAQLATSLTQQQLAEVLSALTGLVTQRIQRIERAKQEIEVLLNHMAEKLDEIGRWVADQGQSQSQSQESSETLNVQLIGEMKAMGESVESAVDLNQIRTQVRRRLDSIGQHLQDFRQREAELADLMRTRTAQMQARVAQLESETKKLHAQLKDEQRLSMIDALTRIPNRLAYEKRIEEELKRMQRFEQPACLAVWDVDHFKRINDTYGHRAGDRVLQAVAEWLAQRLRSTDFLARYGGEEFVMVLCGTQPNDALCLIDELREGIANIRFKSSGTPVSITISSGITALLPSDSAAAAFERADRALYRAKEAGRNRCVVG